MYLTWSSACGGAFSASLTILTCCAQRLACIIQVTGYMSGHNVVIGGGGSCDMAGRALLHVSRGVCISQRACAAARCAATALHRRPCMAYAQ